MSISNVEIGSPLVFNNYSVDYIKFESNPKFDSDSITISFDLKSEINIVESKADVKLLLDLFPDASKNNYPFEMKLSVTGHFQTNEDFTEDSESLFKINAIAILFPYIRALVTTFTSNCNVPPLILPPINVHKVITQSDKSLVVENS